jgi:hypothetical protein
MTDEARKSTENGEDKRASLGGKTKVKYSDNILPMVGLKLILKFSHFEKTIFRRELKKL